MKLNINQFYGFLLLMALTLMLEGCSGCSHRSRKARERHRDRVERRESRRERHRDRDRDNDLDYKGKGGMYTEDYIETIAESDDYDKMLDCQFSKLNEINRLKNEYFRGDMPDKEAKERLKEIENKYSPVDKALQKADNEGLLTYNQHKRQVKLVGDYIKVAKSVANRLGSDLSSLLDI